MSLCLGRPGAVVAVALWLGLAALAGASDTDEFKVKREEVFEFTERPQITRAGDHIEVAFGSKGWCDATVAIEDGDGRIVRHLASGVLGPKAPPPLQKDSLKQRLVWDGKDDQGRYVDDKDSHRIRVSLGLKPKFEKNLYWSPYKRVGEAAPLLQAGEDGVYVFDGFGVDHIRRYDRDGAYAKTIYPFPADKMEQVKGLEWFDFPHGRKIALKQGLYQHTLFTSGDNSSLDDKGAAMEGNGASAMALRGKHLATAKERVNRMATDGSSGGMEIYGPKASVTLEKMYFMDRGWGQTHEAGPTSAAISPDGKWLYLAGYAWRKAYNFDTLHAVTRMPLDGKEPAKVFLGKVEIAADNSGYQTNGGTGPGEFRNATSVDCDAQGRVYVGDFMNDRVQVFDPEGKHLKSIPVAKPAVVRVHRKTGEIYVFSWYVPSRLLWGAPVRIDPSLTRLGTFDDPKVLARYALPMAAFGGPPSTYTSLATPLYYTGEIDSWAEPLTVWLGRENRNDLERGIHPGNGGASMAWDQTGILVLREKNGKLEGLKNFGEETLKQVPRAHPPSALLQKFCFNPKTRKLYLHEGDGGHYRMSVKQLLEIDVENVKYKTVDLPFTTQDVAFDMDGLAYLRTVDVVTRMDIASMREVPFDYGEELEAVGEVFGTYAPVLGGLVMPSTFPVCAHTGGLYVSPKGHILVACSYRYMGVSRTSQLEDKPIFVGKPYSPNLYPGRISSSTSSCLHVWNKHGEMVYEDAVPGIGQVDGVGMDRDDNIYTMATPTRVLDGKKFMNEMSETLMKFKPKGGKVICSSKGVPVPLPDDAVPKKPPQLHNGTLGNAWVENAEWFYGAVGFAGFNPSRAGGGCACRFARFALDYYGRSIAPEQYQFTVAVLDSSGNLITRIGRYGNVDSAGPGSAVPLGGDEVGLVNCAYVGTHTDRRVFLSDTGNGRLVSVKLDYHAGETISLKDVPDAAP